MAGAPTTFAVTDLELGSMPFPALPGRLSQRKSKTRTKAVAPRTFEKVEEWPGFLEGAEELARRLDDSIACNGNPWTVFSDGLKPAGSEIGVHGAMDNVLFPQVNKLARKLGFNLSYWCGGSARSLSQTDLVILDDRQPQDMGNLSARVFGNGEAKGPWEWDLKNQFFLDALQNEKCQAMYIEVAQQLFGDMVMDESMFGFLTNFNQSVFFQRRLHNTKELLASPVIRIDDAPVLKFLFVLQEAEKNCHAKQLLRRALVVETPPGGFHMVLPQIFMLTKSGRVSKRPLSSVLNLQANPKHGRPRRHTVRQAQELAEENDEDCFSTRPIEHGQLDRLTAKQAKEPVEKDETMIEDHNCIPVYDEENFVTIPVYNMDDLGITGALVGIGKFGNVLSGRIGKYKVALKTFDLRGEEAAHAFVHEQKVYIKLKNLQGESIPRLLFVGRLPHSNVLYLALSNEGRPNAINKLKGRRGREAEQQLWNALDGFHALGVVHGDLKLEHICWRTGKPKFIDLEYCKLNATEDDIELERMEMEALLQDCLA